MMKRHCEVGSNILRKAGLPFVIAEVALQHHERLDGSGNPLGLRGDQISLAARIIAVADDVEAMMNHRPYRPALGVDAALSEIAQGRGTAFDENVVDACLNVFRAGFTVASSSPQLGGP